MLRRIFFSLVVASLCVAFTQSQEPDEPYVEEDDIKAAALTSPPPGSYVEPEPKYPDGVNTIPGAAERDYPTYDQIWKTSFSCAKRPPGFYADVEARCQIWHTCDTRGHQQSFLCTNGTIYSQANRVCEWWYNVNCVQEEVEKNYHVNDDLYQIPESAKHWQEENNAANNNNEEPGERGFPVHSKPVQTFDNFRGQQEPQRPAPTREQRPRDFPQERPRDFPPANQERPRDFPPANPQPRPKTQVVKIADAPHILDRTQIIDLLLNGKDDNSHLSEDERFPLKAKLRMQREREAKRLKEMEEAKSRERQQQLQDLEPSPLPVRLVVAAPNKPAIVRVTNNFGVNPPKSTPFRPVVEQQQYTSAPTTSRQTFPPQHQQQQEQQQQYSPTTARPTFAPPLPPTPALPPNYKQQQQRVEDNTIRPAVRPTFPSHYKIRPNDYSSGSSPAAPSPSSSAATRFEGTDETQFPQQQARQFPSYNSARPVRIEDPPLDDSQGNNNRQQQQPQQQPERRFPVANELSPNPNRGDLRQRFPSTTPTTPLPDVNADGNRFQNGESRQPRPSQRRPENRPQPVPQNNRFQPESAPASPAGPPPEYIRIKDYVDRGQLVPTRGPQQPQQQQQTRNFRPEENTQQPQAPPQRRPRPRNEEPPQEFRRPVQTQEPEFRRPVQPQEPEQQQQQHRPIQQQRRPVEQQQPQAPPPRNAVREPQEKPEEAPRAPPPQFAAPESHRQKFRHSTPRRHNVQFAPSSRSNREIQAQGDGESQVSEESIQHPVPSVYNNRLFQQQQQQQQRQLQRLVSQEPTYTPAPAPTTRFTPTQAATAPALPPRRRQPVRVVKVSGRPTPSPETVQDVSLANNNNNNNNVYRQKGINGNPTIVRIIVKQRPNKEQSEDEQEQRSAAPREDSLEEEFIHREVERDFGGRYEE